MSVGTGCVASGLFAVALLVGVDAGAQTTEPTKPTDEEVRLDLFRVISLEGLHCGAVESFERDGDSDYMAHCENGKEYLVDVNEHRGVRVLDPKTSKEAGDWSTPLHHVANLLFSVLTLGGHLCESVAVDDVERQGTTDHAVTCRNGRRYRVDASDDGMVRVTPP